MRRPTSTEGPIRDNVVALASAVRPRPTPAPPGEPAGLKTASCEDGAEAEKAEEALNTSGFRASNKDKRRAEADLDRALLERAKHGDTSAFRELVVRHQGRAFHIAFGLVRDEHDAREIVQEAFLRVHKGLHGFQHGSAFFTWLYRIVSNLAIDHIRRPGRDVQVGLDELEPEWESEVDSPFLARLDGRDPHDAAHRAQLAERITVALDTLPPYHRGVIVMREVEGMSYEEMAEAMGVSKGTIMSRLFHARQKLQRALAELYTEIEGRPPPARQGEQS